MTLCSSVPASAASNESSARPAETSALSRFFLLWQTVQRLANSGLMSRS